MEKKLYKYLAIFGGGLLLIILFLIIIVSLTGGRSYKYEEVEEILVKAAKKYAKEHQAVYPLNPGESYVISSSILASNGYMDELADYISDDDVVCTGNVEIFHASLNNYDFVPTYRCGNKYSTIKLAEQILKDNEYGVISGSGLYERVDGNFVLNEEDFANGDNYTSLEYVFRGDEVNNYVQIDDMYFRIVSIDEQDNILVIYDSAIKTASSWDNRYNEDVDKTQGINIYEQNGIKSRVMEQVESFYNGDAVLLDKIELSEKIKYMTSPMDLCVGKRSTSDSDTSGKIECSTILEKQNAGLLAAYQYMSASLDDECKTVLSHNCGNYNYLSQYNDYFWLLTGNGDNTNESYLVARIFVDSTICSAKNSIKPVILLGARSLYLEGTGTYTNPYKIKTYN